MYELGKEELEGLEKIFKSKKLFRYQGKDVPTETSLFEKDFSQNIGMNFALAVTSGTNALILALEALGISEGDEVIVPCYTFVATISAILHVGAKPIVTGIKDDLTLDVSRIKITTKTKAIIPVHMDGLPCDMENILKIAKENNLLVIEDVAQAVGGSFRGKKLGSFGDASCFSFNVDKIISAGEGGAVCFKDETHYKKALQLHDGPAYFGATFKDYLSDLPMTLGHSMRVSEITSVILRAQVSKLDSIVEKLRVRKNIWRIVLSIVESSDFKGDCGTTIHINVGDPNRAQKIAKDLTDQGVLAIPLYARPAHCHWQWLGLLNLSKTEIAKLNFALADDRMKISSIIKIAVDYEADIEQTKNIALKVKNLLS